MTEKVWNVAAYCRLSRDDGDKAESNSIGSQRDIIREFLRDRTDMVIVKEYIDDGYSGVNFDRPGFKQMMEDIRQKKINCIVCKDLSRFARNYIDSGRYLEKIFPFMGVRFIAINDSYDSNGEKTQADSLIVAPSWTSRERWATSSARLPPTVTGKTRKTKTGCWWTRKRRRS